MQQLRKKLTYLKPPDSLQRPRISRCGLKTLLCIFWNSSGVLHDRVSEMRLMATPYAKYHKLTEVAKNYCSHYDKTSEKLRACTFGRQCSKAHSSQGKTTLNCYAYRHSSYRSCTATNDVHSIRYLQRFLAVLP